MISNRILAALLILFVSLSGCGLFTSKEQLDYQDRAHKAIDALRAAGSAGELGVKLDDFSSKVVEAKVQVDRFTSVKASRYKIEGLSEAVEGALQDYVWALDIWVHSPNGANYYPVGNEVFTRDQALLKKVQDESKGEKEIEGVTHYSEEAVLKSYWAIAKAKLDKADSLVPAK